MADNNSQLNNSRDLRSTNLTSLDFNFITDANGFSVPAGATGNKIATAEPHGLGSRLDSYNGGVPTLRRETAGALFNSADPDGSAHPATDQRGLARVNNGRADIGATEFTTHTVSPGGPYTINEGASLTPVPAVTLLADAREATPQLRWDLLDNGDWSDPVSYGSAFSFSWNQLNAAGLNSGNSYPLRVEATVRGIPLTAATTIAVVNVAPSWTNTNTHTVTSQEKDQAPSGVLVSDLISGATFDPGGDPVSVAVTAVASEYLQYRLNDSSAWTSFPGDIGTSNALLLGPGCGASSAGKEGCFSSEAWANRAAMMQATHAGKMVFTLSIAFMYS